MWAPLKRITKACDAAVFSIPVHPNRLCIKLLEATLQLRQSHLVCFFLSPSISRFADSVIATDPRFNRVSATVPTALSTMQSSFANNPLLPQPSLIRGDSESSAISTPDQTGAPPGVPVGLLASLARLQQTHTTGSSSPTTTLPAISPDPASMFVTTHIIF